MDDARLQHPQHDMPRPKAWIEGTFAEQPLSAAASLVLHARLKKIDRLAQQAAELSADAGAQVEPVHRLRVATRRASAALEVFKETLPGRRRRWIEKQLKRARRAANAARNLDVLIQRYQERAAADEELSWLAKDLQRQRERAQKPLAKVARRFRRKGLEQRVEELFWRIRWRDEENPEPALLAAAEKNLADVAADLVGFDAAQANSESLHQLRICGKRLRYSLEIFAAAMPELCERVYPTVVEMQNLLGRANDHATALEFFEERSARGKHAPVYAALADEERKACDSSQATCAAWLRGDAFRSLCDALTPFAGDCNAPAGCDAPLAARPR